MDSKVIGMMSCSESGVLHGPHYWEETRDSGWWLCCGVVGEKRNDLTQIVELKNQQRSTADIARIMNLSVSSINHYVNQYSPPPDINSCSNNKFHRSHSYLNVSDDTRYWCPGMSPNRWKDKPKDTDNTKDDTDRKAISELAADGLSTRKIAARVGTSASTVRRRLAEPAVTGDPRPTQQSVRVHRYPDMWSWLEELPDDEHLSPSILRWLSKAWEAARS